MLKKFSSTEVCWASTGSKADLAAPPCYREYGDNSTPVSTEKNFEQFLGAAQM